ncbi:ferrous iron transport protein A [Clostridiales bacterium COT073_COT-073]|nr:ferrous iron transport protein A [Clostridiales bacterium COT073_COT-073]
MPLTMATAGIENTIQKVGGNEKTKKYLESLGFVSGSTVILVSEVSGNVIVSVKGVRIAIDKQMAMKILV